MKRVLIAVAAFTITAPAHASVLFDASADTVGMDVDFVASNYTYGLATSGQNFLMKFTLAGNSMLTGVDIYSTCRVSGCLPGGVGTAADVRIRNDVGGFAGPTNLHFIETTISAIDNEGSSTFSDLERLHASFSPIALSAGTYWIGLAGRETEIGLNIKFNEPQSNAVLGNGDAFFGSPPVYTAAFRVLGNAGGVPEPAAWAMMLAGFGLVGSALRRREKMTVTFA